MPVNCRQNGLSFGWFVGQTNWRNSDSIWSVERFNKTAGNSVSNWKTLFWKNWKLEIYQIWRSPIISAISRLALPGQQVASKSKHTKYWTDIVILSDFVCTISLLWKANTVWAEKRSTSSREPNSENAHTISCVCSVCDRVPPRTNEIWEFGHRVRSKPLHLCIRMWCSRIVNENVLTRSLHVMK